MKVNIINITQGEKRLNGNVERLEKNLRDIILNTFDLSCKGIMYHYTSANTLPFIIKERNELCLRFTDYRFLNDKSEGVEIKEFFLSVLHELFVQGKISKDFLNEATRQYELKESENQNLYVACFSQDSDSLPMWNYYLKGGKYEGYSLGFVFDIQKYLRREVLFKRKVIYNDALKKKLISYLILETVDNHSSLDVEKQCKQLITIIHELSLVMKKECFSHEKEVRLILNLSLYEKMKAEEEKNKNDKEEQEKNVEEKESEKKSTENIDENRIMFHSEKNGFINKNGIMVPYSDFKFKNLNLLREICYAPTMSPEQTELGLKCLIEAQEHDYSNMKIYPSKIPVRY